MKKLEKDQRGFTIIELLIAIAITGLITWGITMTIFQVFDINTRSTNRMAAITQLENAGLWVSNDVQMAQSVNATGSSGFPLILNWNDWDTGFSHAVNYTLEDMSSGEFKELQRSHSVNGGNSTPTHVAEYIDSEQTSCYPLGTLPPGGVLNFTVTATVGGESETRVYKVTPRVG
jgi:prepilin-type N-terminal cleavage/methylation domain-containing protein